MRPLHRARPQVRKEMLDELARVAKEGKLKGFENIKALYLETEAFRCEPGCLLSCPAYGDPRHEC